MTNWVLEVLEQEGKKLNAILFNKNE